MQDLGKFACCEFVLQGVFDHLRDKLPKVSPTAARIALATIEGIVSPFRSNKERSLYSAAAEEVFVRLTTSLIGDSNFSLAEFEQRVWNLLYRTLGKGEIPNTSSLLEESAQLGRFLFLGKCLSLDNLDAQTKESIQTELES